MSCYHRVLLALELSSESDQLVIKKTQSLLTGIHATLTLVHAVEQLVNFGSGYSIPGGVDVEEELVRGAQKVLSGIGEQLKVPKKQQIIKVGSAKHIIIEEAKAIDADLIIVGSHGRHGIRLLLGSTANAVIHGAQCDVLAVRVGIALPS